MEKKLYELSIDPEIQGLLPPLRDSEKEMLEESLLKDGCLEPILVWGDTIIDGHARYALCHKHGIPFFIHPMRFADKDEAVLWAARTQLMRRNLSPFQRCELVAHLEPRIQAEALKRQSCGKSLPQEAKGDTRDLMARMAAVSHGTWEKAKRIMEKADGETKQMLRETKISINYAYKMLLTSETARKQQSKQVVSSTPACINFSIDNTSLQHVNLALKEVIADIAVGETSKWEILEKLDTIKWMIEKAGG